MIHDPPGYAALSTTDSDDQPSRKLIDHQPSPAFPAPTAGISSSRRPASNPGTRVYYELFTTSPSGPLTSSSPIFDIPNRSYVILEDITPPRTWGTWCARISAIENIHPSRLSTYTADGQRELYEWDLMHYRDDVKPETVEHDTKEKPFLVKCYIAEGETQEDASSPKPPSEWTMWTSWFCGN